MTHSYLGLNGGANLGAWRFRHGGNLSNGDQAGISYQSVLTNLQRSIVSMKSQLVLGDAYTAGTIFDSVGFRGVQMSSDERMYPKSQRGYAPVVRGIASSNARVQIRQNGKVLRETNVATGAFAVGDLRSGNASFQQSLTRAADREVGLAYGLSAGRSSGASRPTEVAGDVAYRASKATVTGSASNSGSYSQVGAGLSGTVVAYAGGLAFAPEVSDTMAIVEAKDATGARVSDGNRLRVGPGGRALVSNLTPFESNQVEIERKVRASDMPSKTAKNVAPTSGAVVLLDPDSQKTG